MNNEKAFREKLLGTMNPDWIAARHDDPGALTSQYTVRLYCVDTSTGWLASGAVSESNFKALRANMSAETKRTATGMAVFASNEASKAMAPADAKATIQAIEGVAIYMSATRTYDIVQGQKGDLKGHWIALVYGLRNGARISRPIYFSEPTVPGVFMPHQDLLNLVRRTIDSDLANPNSMVSQEAMRGGGVVFHPAWLAQNEGDSSDTPESPKG